MTLDEAKRLSHRDTIFRTSPTCLYTEEKIKSKTYKWRVNGKPKTWKRSPNRVRVPIKYGLYTYDYITEDNLNEFMLPFRLDDGVPS